MHSRVHTWQGCAGQGACVAGVCMVSRIRGRRDGHCSRWYTSYWNVFLLLIAKEVNVFTGVCHSVHNWPHGFSVTAHGCWLLGHLLQCGRYASYWDVFLLFIVLQMIDD